MLRVNPGTVGGHGVDGVVGDEPLSRRSERGRGVARAEH